MCMTNHHVHHLISTKLHFAPPKCMSAQNYIVNLDMYVHCEPPSDYILCPSPCVPPEYVHCDLTWENTVIHGQKMSFCSILHVNHQKNKKNVGGATYSPKNRSPCAPWCKTQVGGAQHTTQVNGTQRSSVPLKWCTALLPPTLNIVICYIQILKV